MKASDKEFGKIVKRIVRQEHISGGEVLRRWDALQDRGDRIVIETLNRLNGWEAFVLWSESELDIREKLHRLMDRAGISEAGVLALRSAGFLSDEGDTDRSRSLRILQNVRQGQNENWDPAAESMLKGSDLFEGTLQLLELEESPESALFLTQLLKKGITQEQERMVRKTLIN
jgi:hypothetical protein